MDEGFLCDSVNMEIVYILTSDSCEVKIIIINRLLY